jgi:hypothetical protein
MSIFTITGARVINAQVIERKLAQAFNAWTRENVNDHFYDQFHNPIWAYDRETKRKNPNAPIRLAQAGALRDIVDYGELYKSGERSYAISETGSGPSAHWSWDARGDSGYYYARDVHEGEGTSAGNPRQWTDDVAMPLKFNSSLLRKELLDRIRATFLGS